MIRSALFIPEILQGLRPEREKPPLRTSPSVLTIFRWENPSGYFPITSLKTLSIPSSQALKSSGPL